MIALLPVLINFIISITPGDPNNINAEGFNPDIARHIANFHTLFNFINLFIFLPFIPALAKFIEKIIPGQAKSEYGLVHINDILLDTPPLAVSGAKKELKRMSDTVLEMLKLSKAAFFEEDLKKVEKIFELEDTVDLLEKDILDYMVKLVQRPINEQNSREINDIMHIVHDIEKISDFSENIAKFTKKIN
jgi:phosphate:Na+ symporter